jgi:hypothetical protein
MTGSLQATMLKKVVLAVGTDSDSLSRTGPTTTARTTTVRTTTARTTTARTTTAPTTAMPTRMHVREKRKGH